MHRVYKNYRWVITRDHLYDPESDSQSREETDPEGYVLGPYCVKFKLYDDDGELYYEGIIDMNEKSYGSESMFDPLDWAMHDSGCTRMDICEAGKWQTL